MLGDGSAEIGLESSRDFWLGMQWALINSSSGRSD